MNRNNAVLMLYGFLNGKICSHEDLVEIIKNELTKLSSLKNLTKTDIEEIAYEYEYTYGSKTFVPGVTLINSKSIDTWFHKKKRAFTEEQHKYQKRYEQYLILEHYGEEVKNNIISEAEKVLSLCANPDSTEKKRGLVMGEVQSGKTSNYLALANIACDYGYKIVLILAGTTDSLRIQTQERTDEGLIGAISSSIGNNEKIKYIGVGTYGKGGYYAIPLTTNISDFTPLNLTSNDLSKPQILVVKKNKAILEAVKKWLKPGQTNVTSNNILIIDDECDNASVNTKQAEDPSTINGLIRDIYNNFTCSTYVGYTATPFANIFINPDKIIGFDDLFPADFIHRLKSSGNKHYFGIDKVFRDNSKHLKIIKDNEINRLPAKHKKDVSIPVLWESLKDAICVFIICNCIRTIRKDEIKHRSMMINVSPYNSVQNRIAALVEDYLENIRYAIQQYDRYDIERFTKHKELKRIFDLYEKESLFNQKNDMYNGKKLNELIPFDKVKEQLYDEISKFRVAIINNKIKGDQRFRYKDYKETGARVIAIGGFVLSRGLTLEGLMTSYYSRNSTAYDTLLQMCRWFGYRPNYEDLCYVYMNQISFDCFCAVSDAVDNLDVQLDAMAARGSSPKEFGLMIMESPETLETDLLITSRNKMKESTEIIRGLNYSGIDIDTSKLFKDPSKNKHNLNEVNNLVRVLKAKKIAYEKVKNRHMFRNIDNDTIADFVEKLDIPIENKKFDTESISSFIRQGKFYDKWDVVFATGESNEVESNLFEIEGLAKIPPVKRSFSYVPGEEIVRISKNNNRLLDPNIFNSGLTIEQVEEAREIAAQRLKKSKNDNPTPVAKDFLAVKNRNPIIVILPIVLRQDNEDYTKEKQKIIDDYKNNGFLVGFGVGFAGRESKVMMRFRINKIKRREYLNKFAETEDEIEND